VQPLSIHFLRAFRPEDFSLAATKQEQKMYKLTTIESLLARILAVAAAGVIVGAASVPIAQHFNFNMVPQAQYALGAVAALLAWLASRKAFDFTNDCLDVSPSPFSPALHRRALPMHAPEPAGSANAVELNETRDAGGNVNITLTVTGLTKREFNSLRGRISGGVYGVKTTTKNLHDGRRQIEVHVPANSKQAATIAKLKELAGKTV
jgi:hypothetical protein